MAYKPDFTGRATRSELLGTLGACAIATAVLVPLVVIVKSLLLAMTILTLLLLIAVPLVAVCIRRLHDTGRGWSAFGVVAIPYVGLLVLAVFLALNGEKHDNVFGPNPRPPSG
ncbi:DUF805 domain-containing protein [Chelatococcus reniformis]|uniref:DUF805 domain-containing protein n=1 Tax=Chelatococcus reniformis TaxID=1494448 RepID=UPI00166E4B10|nr:DUF805 domain-containing protein [Chelatococcus reniformis]